MGERHTVDNAPIMPGARQSCSGLLSAPYKAGMLPVIPNGWQIQGRMLHLIHT